MTKTYFSVIIPVFNEQPNLEPLYQRLLAVFNQLNQSYEIIFIDDGSTDQGFAILKEISQKDSRVKLISFRKNFGQTAALAAGFDFSQGEIIIALDADLENDPQDIPRLLTELNKGYDIVSGWRRNRWQNQFFSRRLTSNIANWLISEISGLKLHDYGCTLKVYRAEVVKDIQLYGEMHRFIPALAFWQGARISELAVNYQPRRFGQSKYGPARIFKVLLDLVTLKFLSGYAAKPIYFFGKIGLFSLFLGFLTFLWALYYKLTGQKDFIQTPLPVVVALFIILAILLILIGLLAEMVMRTYYQSSQKKSYAIKETKGFNSYKN